MQLPEQEHKEYTKKKSRKILALRTRIRLYMINWMNKGKNAKGITDQVRKYEWYIN